MVEKYKTMKMTRMVPSRDAYRRQWVHVSLSLKKNKNKKHNLNK